MIEGSYGLRMGKPLAHLREYVTILRALLWEGAVDFSGDYFTVKLAAASAALATFYLGAVAGALVIFPWLVTGFDAGDFLALSAVHLFAALFSATFAGLMAVIAGA